MQVEIWSRYLRRWYSFTWWWPNRCSSCYSTSGSLQWYSPLTFHLLHFGLLIVEFILSSLSSLFIW